MVDVTTTNKIAKWIKVRVFKLKNVRFSTDVLKITRIIYIIIIAGIQDLKFSINAIANPALVYTTSKLTCKIYCHLGLPFLLILFSSVSIEGFRAVLINFSNNTKKYSPR